MATASVWAAATITLLTVTGCAPTETGPRQPRRCFAARDVRNFTAVNSSTVNIRVGRDVYRVDVMGACPDINWTNRMALVTTGNSLICVGSGLGTSIVTRGSSGRPQRCPVTSITALTPEQIQALPGRHRP